MAEVVVDPMNQQHADRRLVAGVRPVERALDREGLELKVDRAALRPRRLHSRDRDDEDERRDSAAPARHLSGGGAIVNASMSAICFGVSVSTSPSASSTPSTARGSMIWAFGTATGFSGASAVRRDRRGAFAHDEAAHDLAVAQLEHLRLVLIRNDLRRPEDRLEDVPLLEAAGDRRRIGSDVPADPPKR